MHVICIIGGLVKDDLPISLSFGSNSAHSVDYALILLIILRQIYSGVLAWHMSGFTNYGFGIVEISYRAGKDGAATVAAARPSVALIQQVVEKQTCRDQEYTPNQLCLLGSLWDGHPRSAGLDPKLSSAPSCQE